MKQYLILSFKKKLPLFIILAVIFFTFAMISVANTSFIRYENCFEDGCHSFQRAFSNSIAIIIALFVVILFLPLFSMNYRYSLQKSDTFRQVAFKDRSIRIGEHIITLTTTLIAFTFAYVIFVLGLFAKQINTVVPANNEFYHYSLITFEYIYFIPQYFTIIIFAILQYFVSYLLVARSNNLLNSLITLTMGQMFLLTFFGWTALMFTEYVDAFSLQNASISYPISTIYLLYENLIVYGEFTYIFEGYDPYLTMNIVSTIISSIIFLGLGILGIISLLFEKDPSGEWAGKPETDKPYQEIIYHAGAASLGILIGAYLARGESIVGYIFFVLIFSSAYYTLYGLLRHNFKLKLSQILIMSGVMLSIIIMSVLIYVVHP